MYKLASRCGFILLSLCLNVSAESPQPEHHVIEKTLTLLPGQAPACNEVFSSLPISVKFSYWTIPNTLWGGGNAIVINPTAGNPPILSELSQSGESDRLGFAHYYGARSIPMDQHGKHLFLASVILDVCPDHSSEAAVVMNVPLPASTSQAACILATPTWNHYCR